MRTTGFDNTNRVPTVADVSPYTSGNTGPAFVKQYDDANKHGPVPEVPGQVGPTGNTGEITPNNGLVTGRMPLSDQLNPTLVHQENPYPNGDLYGKIPFVANQPPHNQDWRAVDVGPETDRKSPGKIAVSPPQQGMLQPTFTGKFQYQSKTPDGAFPKPSKIENMMTGNYMNAVYLFGAATIVSAGMWARENGEMWAIIALICAAVAAMMMTKHGKEQDGHENYNVGKNEKLSVDRRQLRYHADPSMQDVDTSRKQVFRPRTDSEPDPNPYPKPLDAMTDTNVRLAAQGLNQSNVEGPRGDYWYKRGPTPENRQRVRDKDLMRSAKQFNMNERELEEYMARLDGEMPDQFYQAHPYMPVAPFWDHRQQIDDDTRIHGIATEPGAYNRKWTYRDPKIQQGGARTMHTKEPPPGSDVYFDKVHPWMEPKDQIYSQPFDADEYTEFMTGNRSGVGAGSSSAKDLHGNNRLSSNDIGKVANARQAEDEYYRNMYGVSQKSPDDLPAELEPIPTSREGVGQMMQEQKKKYAMQVANQTDRQLNFMKNVQGYGYTVLPPHPQAPQMVPPTVYANNPPYPINYAPPSNMPSPNLQYPPQRDTVATAGERYVQPHAMAPPAKSTKERTEEEFAAAFVSSTVDDDVVNAEIKNAGKR